MPMIHTRVSGKITPEQEKRLAEELGKAISLIGKSEEWLMLQFEDRCRLWFRGGNQMPLAFVQVLLLGKAEKDATQHLTGKITQILSDVLQIAPAGIYVAYGETGHWGWNGSNF